MLNNVVDFATMRMTLAGHFCVIGLGGSGACPHFMLYCFATLESSKGKHRLLGPSKGKCSEEHFVLCFPFELLP
jgi:hypothetical protein